MKSILSQSKHFLFIILGVVIFTFPRFYQELKILILFLLLLVGYLEKLHLPKFSGNKYAVYWYLGYIFWAFAWSTLGFFKGNPGIKDVFRVEFVWIVVLTIFTLFLDVERKTIVKFLYVSSLVCALIGLHCILEPSLGSLPFLRWLPFEPVRNVQGLVRTSLPNIAFMSFLFPFLLFNGILSKGEGRILSIISLIASFLFILLAGRRVIQGVAVFFIILFLIKQRKHLNLNFLLICFGILFMFSFLAELFEIINLKLYYDLYYKTLFDDFQNEPRYLQLVEFWKYTKEHPIFGVGLGKGIPTYIANTESPWHYEAVYSMYLYQTGFVGMSLFVSLFVSLFFKLRSISTTGKSIAMGLLGYLMATSTNPYINSGFDYKFPILICLMFISSGINDKTKKYQSILRN